MTGIPSYICDLLYFNDCVIVPGFGGFIADYFPGGMAESNNSFTPPAKRIAFNLHIREDDTLLSNTIGALEGLDKEIVSNKLEAFVNDTYRKLADGERVIFNGLGTFFISQENRLQFVPDKAANFLIDSFGLDSFHFPVVVNPRQVRSFGKELKKSDPIEKARRNHRIRRIIISAPLVAAMVMVPFYSGLLNQMNFSAINPFSSGHKRIEITETRQVDTALINPKSLDGSISFLTDKKNALFYSQKKQIIEILETPKVDTAKEIDPIVEIVEPEVLVEIKPQPKTDYCKLKYHIIAGSLQTQNQAERVAKTLTEKGFEAIIFPKDNKGRIRISIGGFDSQPNALNMIDSIRKNSSVEVWLLTL